MAPWSHLLTQTLSYKIPSGRTRGDVTYGSLLTAKCRAEPKQAMIRDADGHDQVQSGTQIYCEVDLPLESLVWAPGANTANTDEAYMPRKRGNAALATTGQTLYVYWFMQGAQ